TLPSTSIAAGSAAVWTKIRVQWDSTRNGAPVVESASRTFSISLRMNRRRVPRAFVDNSAERRTSTRVLEMSSVIALPCAYSTTPERRTYDHPHELTGREVVAGDPAHIVETDGRDPIGEAFPVVGLQTERLDRTQTGDDPSRSL